MTVGQTNCTQPSAVTVGLSHLSHSSKTFGFLENNSSRLDSAAKKREVDKGDGVNVMRSLTLTPSRLSSSRNACSKFKSDQFIVKSEEFRV